MSPHCDPFRGFETGHRRWCSSVEIRRAHGALTDVGLRNGRVEIRRCPSPNSPTTGGAVHRNRPHAVGTVAVEIRRPIRTGEVTTTVHLSTVEIRRCPSLDSPTTGVAVHRNQPHAVGTVAVEIRRPIQTGEATAAVHLSTVEIRRWGTGLPGVCGTVSALSRPSSRCLAPSRS